MNRRLHLVCALASFCFLSVPPAAHGAGDPAAWGASLYASYGCPACHTRTPTSAIASGASVAVLLHFIETDLGMNNAYSLTLANNPTDLADIAAYIAAATGQQPPATTPNLDQHGLTGSWYEPATSGQGVEVEIYPDRTPGVGYAFVSWFTYDTSTGGADHQRSVHDRRIGDERAAFRRVEHLPEHRRQLRRGSDYECTGRRKRHAELRYLLERSIDLRLRRRDFARRDDTADAADAECHVLDNDTVSHQRGLRPFRQLVRSGNVGSGDHGGPQSEFKSALHGVVRLHTQRHRCRQATGQRWYTAQAA